MITYIIDGNNIHDKNDFHVEIAKTFQFPDYYGKNLDALWDCLTDCVSDWKGKPVEIIWIAHHLSENRLGNEYFKKIIDGLFDLKNNWHTNLTIELK